MRPRFPSARGAREITQKQSRSPLDYALDGGEDFELLLTLAPGDVEKVRSHLLNNTGTQVTIIGEIVGLEKRVCIVGKDGREKEMSQLGYQHFLD